MYISSFFGYLLMNYNKIMKSTMSKTALEHHCKINTLLIHLEFNIFLQSNFFIAVLEIYFICITLPSAKLSLSV